MEVQYQKELQNHQKFYDGIKYIFGSIFVNMSTEGNTIFLFFSESLNQSQLDQLNIYVDNFIDYSTAEQIEITLETKIYPFIKDMIRKFTSENISMGITQAGKTGTVLSFFASKIAIPSEENKVSLKDTLDSGSLYVTLDVLQYYRDNPSKYNGLDPFVTDARLLEMKNKIETFLGIQLSI